MTSSAQSNVTPLEPQTEESMQKAKEKAQKPIQDPLLMSLLFIMKFHGRPSNTDALTAGLPLKDNKLTLDSFLRSSERSGFVSEVVSHELETLTNLILPCVLLLEDDKACVLVKKDNRGNFMVVSSELPDSVQTVSYQDLSANYSGQLILIQPKFHFDARSDVLEMPKPRSWFWGTLVSHWRIYLLALMGTVMVNLFVLASPLFVMNVYDRVVPNTAFDTLWVLAAGVIGVSFFDFVVKAMRAYFIDLVGKRSDFVISTRIFDQVLNMRLSSKQKSSGVLANTMREFESLRDFFTSATLTTIGDFPFVLLFIFVVWLIGGPMAYIPLIAVPLVLVVGILIQVPLSKIMQQSFQESSQKNAHLFEVLNSIETVKSAGTEAWATKTWEKLVGKVAQTAMKSRMLSNLAIHFAQMMLLLTSVGIIVMGVYQIEAGNMTMGTLIACMILNSRAMAPLIQVAQLLVRYQQSNASLHALDAIMKAPVERPESKRFLHRSKLKGEIEFREVSFSYPDEQIPSIKNISFKLKPGERVGIIGRIGAGKSTLLKMIMNLYEPEQGAILVDGIDIRQMDPVDLRRNMGYVLQDNVLFYGTVRDNITMGAPYVEDDQILRASQISGVDYFVRQHPLGYDQPVGERGEYLSGGQRQAIVIARSLLMDPPILLLDEPTGQMDHSTQRMFLSHLEHDLKDKTLILVTHRTRLLSAVNRLLVVDKGELVADGPKEKVLKALMEQ